MPDVCVTWRGFHTQDEVEAQALEMKLPLLGLRFSLGFVGRAHVVEVGACLVRVPSVSA